MTLEEEAIQVVQAGIHSATPARLNFLHQELIGGYPNRWYCTTCPGKLRAVFLSLKMKFYTKPNTVMATNQKYTLKNPKGLFRPFGTAGWTAETLTDAVAEKYIKVQPEYAQLFNIAESEPAEGGEELTEKEQLQARFLELTGKEPAKSWSIAKLNEEIAEAEQAQ